MVNFPKLASIIIWTLLCISAVAKPPAPALPASAASAALTSRTVKENQLVEHGAYVNKAGASVHSPAHSKTGAAPDGATAKCGDGTFSFSQSRRGTCSHHGGVAAWL